MSLHLESANRIAITMGQLRANPGFVFQALGAGPRVEVLVTDVGPFPIISNRNITAADVASRVVGHNARLIEQRRVIAAERAAGTRATRRTPARVPATILLPPPEETVSLALRAAQARTPAGAATFTMSRPVQQGIFGSIGRVIGGLAGGFIQGGPIGAIRGGIGALGGGGTPPIAPPPQVPGLGGPLPGTIQEAIAERGRRTRAFGGLQIGPLELGIEREAFGETPFVGGPDGTGVGVKIACPGGMHANKSSYFLKDGTFIAKNTRCVRNRRRNNLNPRALTRSMKRLEGFKKAATRASEIRIHKPKC